MLLSASCCQSENASCTYWSSAITSYYTMFQPYDFLALIPVIEGAGGVITDWKGHELYWEASPTSPARSMCSFDIASLKPCQILISHFLALLWFSCHFKSINCKSLVSFSQFFNWIKLHYYFNELHVSGFNVVAAGDKQIHQQALDSLRWKWPFRW